MADIFDYESCNGDPDKIAVMREMETLTEHFGDTLEVAVFLQWRGGMQQAAQKLGIMLTDSQWLRHYDEKTVPDFSRFRMTESPYKS